VLHYPRFGASLVLGHGQACWGVVMRLAGNMSAVERLIVYDCPEGESQ
jgi:hypothetical protein